MDALTITTIWGDKPGGRYQFGIFMDFWPPTVGWNMARSMEASAQINHDTLSYAYSTGGQEKLIEIMFEIFFTKLTLVGSVHFSGIDGRFPLWKGFNVVVKTP